MVSALSPSRAADFMQCPLLYRFRAVDRLPEPASPAMARGTLVHAVLERVFDLPSEERTREATLELLPGQWTRMVQERPELAELVDMADPTQLQAWFDEATRLVERWFTLEDPTRLEPAEREVLVEVDLDGLPVRGYIDRLDIAPDGRMRVVDYKTGRAPSEPFVAKALFQMKFYALVLWRLHGRVPTRLQLVYLGSGEIIGYDPDEHELRAVERKITAVWQAIERALATKDFRPRPSRLCDWCHHRDLCPAWGGTPPPMPVAGAAGDAVLVGEELAGETAEESAEEAFGTAEETGERTVRPAEAGRSASETTPETTPGATAGATAEEAVGVC